MSETVIRPRRDDDLPACVQALAGVHETDGYPVRWPADPRDWLNPRRITGAWIAADGPTVLGHVTLTRPDAAFAAAAGRPESELAVVSRLFVAVEARRGGLAARLLDCVTRAATADGLLPALEVEARATGAIALYERAGWRFVRTDTGHWIAADGQPAKVRIYLGPAAG
jgi:GNAT superfamily N-acetyltransferase